MLKNLLGLSLLLFLYNCTSPGTAFLGPVITGAKTGSVYQASISYSSGKVINVLKDASEDMLAKEKSDKLMDTNTTIQPPVLVAILTPTIEVNDIFEEEPLP